jgi:hypothetical protein
MAKYAFLVHGDQAEYFNLNDRIRLRQHNAWLIAEKIQQSKMAKRQARQMLSAVQLAKRISTDKDITVEEAFNLLQTQGEAASAMLLADYQDETNKLMDSGLSREEQDSQLITIFIRTRGEAMISGTWKKLNDWTDADTELLTEAMTEKVLDFIYNEQQGGKAEEEAEEFDPPSMEDEELGNDPEASNELSESAPQSSTPKMTGTESTQDSSPVESQPETSAKKTLANYRQKRSPSS